MSEAGNARIFKAMFVFLITAAIYLFVVENAAFAAEKVDQSNLPEWDGGWTNVNPAPEGVAGMWQTFTPDRPNLTAVEIDILTANPGQRGDTLTVEIAKDGQVLASAERYVEDGFDGLLRFEFAQAVAVVPGEIYALKVRDTGKTCFGWKYASNTYDRGGRYVFAQERPGTDWFFQTYATAEPRIIYVDDDAAGANDGSSWENAYVYLQDALTDANSAEKPVEIRVAQGAYKPHQSRMPINEFFWRSTSFELINEVVLKGGYAGIKELDPNAREIGLYETTLSGDLYSDDAQVADPCDLQDEPTRAENSFHVVIANGINETTILDGFNITGGNADGPEYFNFCFGGGMYNQDSNPTLINCTFNGNTSSYGGGIFNSYNSSPILTDCNFSENLAITGAGMHNFVECNPILTNCFFSGNLGGGVANSYNSNPILTNCTFSENSAGLGGGMDNRGNSSPTITNCTFSGNSAWGGGGMYNDTDCNPILTNCTFRRNLARSGGGGIENCENSSPILTNCTFIQNSAENYGGGMDNMIDSNPIMTNCIFSTNTAEDDGGGVCNFASSPVLINCTFAQNSAENGNAIGSDIVYDYHRIDPNNMELINCILWDGGNEICNEYGSPTIITYCNIQGGKANIFDHSETVIWGEGNIDVDPEFVQMGYWTEPSPRNPNSSVWIEGDYHLKSEAGRWDPVSESWIIDNVTSPCIDAGDPNMPVGDEPDPNGGRINMGAYGGTSEASKSLNYSWFFETTRGPVLADGLGIVLPHEHIFTDLRGPTTPGYGQANAADVVRVMAPLLTDARNKGVGVLIECSSIGVGRNVAIIAQVAEVSGLPVVVPTGVYGRANFAPPEHRNMTEDELTTLFVSEIRDGIEGTGIKAGFIKIATGDGPMNALEEKFLRAAGRAASETGAAIASHTPLGSNAVRQVDILQSIDPAIRFIWVHAQNESNRSLHLQLAARGVYIEFDSLGWNPGQDSTYITAVQNLLNAGYGDRILLSHDAGWYQPGSANGGTQKPFTYLINTFIPKLRDAGINDATIRMITQTNPVRAFGFKSGK
jgi:phosphotriesterase-related protein